MENQNGSQSPNAPLSTYTNGNDNPPTSNGSHDAFTPSPNDRAGEEQPTGPQPASSSSAPPGTSAVASPLFDARELENNFLVEFIHRGCPICREKLLMNMEPLDSITNYQDVWRTMMARLFDKLMEEHGNIIGADDVELFLVRSAWPGWSDEDYLERQWVLWALDQDTAFFMDPEDPEGRETMLGDLRRDSVHYRLRVKFSTDPNQANRALGIRDDTNGKGA